MVDRRSVMKIGAATLAGALVNLPVLARNAARARAHGAFQRAVFDERFAECRAFAAELHSAGVLTSAIRGDVAKLWYDDLRVHLRENRLPVAGLTDRAALFCLEELARDDPKVGAAHRTLFGAWEGNWIAFNDVHDVALPGATEAPLGFFMYPQGETSAGRLDCLDPDQFKYTITAKEVG